MPDHIHMCLSVPPKYSIAFVIGFLKGKSAVLIHRTVLGKKRVSGLHFWAEDTVLAQLVWMKKPYAITFVSKKRTKTNNWI